MSELARLIHVLRHRKALSYAYLNLSFFWRNSAQWASPFSRLLNHTQQRTTVVRFPLHERSARQRELYLTTHGHPCPGWDVGPFATSYYFLNKSPTRCNKFPVYYPDVCLQLNMFRGFSRSSSKAQ
jgi:hypothetical protein